MAQVVVRVTDLAPDHRVGDSQNCEGDLALTTRQVCAVECHFAEHCRNFFLLEFAGPWRDLLSDLLDRYLISGVFRDILRHVITVVVGVHVHVGSVVLVLGVVLRS